MLRAEQIELALLSIVLERSEHKASFPTVINVAQAVQHRIGLPVPDREVTAALLDAYDNGLLRIGRYIGTTPTPMDRSEDDGYFYEGGFYFTPTPKAHRRQQELAQGSRHGIFISHISEEKPIALLLQSFLQICFPTLPVFVSSDKKSIDSGDRWYESILSGLRKSNVVIVLLSRASIDRRWINFEAGFGMGQTSRVIPLVCRGLDKNDIGLPLGQLQARLRRSPRLTHLCFPEVTQAI